MNEPLDRNKTDLTHKITALAMIYLENRGFKPIETEVSIPGFGIADIGSFVYPTPTEAAKLRLANLKRFGLEQQNYDEIMFRYGPLLTAVIEVKVSRSDYKKDIGRKFNSSWPANLCYLAFPKGLIKSEELPLGWLGLEMDSQGYRVNRRYWNHPMVHPQHPGDTTEFIAALALRADYRTRFARQRTMMKMFRLNNS